MTPETIKALRMQILVLERDVTRSFEDLLEDLRILRKQIIAQGKHEAASYTPDASGNNDSSYDCPDCGGTWRRAPKPN